MAIVKSPSDTTQLENRLRERRQAAGLSQKQLASMAGITRQAVCAVEAGQYSPATSVALQLARALQCRVEDLFSLTPGGEIVQGELVGSLPPGGGGVRAQVTQVANRLLVRPLDGFGELTSLSAAADALVVGRQPNTNRVNVRLLGDREQVRRKIVVAGCDPAMFLAADYLKKQTRETLVPWLMGSGMAIGALKRGEAHAAGVHLADERSGRWNVPDLQRALRGLDCLVVTFAHWEEGLIVQRGNPKKIRTVADLAEQRMKIVNRESGSGARRLLDRQLKGAGISAAKLKGYQDEVLSHLDAAARVRAGLADAAVGARAAATISGLDFIPLQRERYDLVIPRAHYETVQGLRILLDTIVAKPFKDELVALGGYDTGELGKIVELN